jgi:HEPN domain-containing protein
MQREPFGPDDPREWLARARSALLYAGGAPAGVDREDIAFQTQQAAEKAIKAVLIRHGVGFPLTHNLAVLVTLAQKAGREVPGEAARAPLLTRYAVQTRYPAAAPLLSDAEVRDALRIAEAVVRWAEGEIGA